MKGKQANIAKGTLLLKYLPQLFWFYDVWQGVLANSWCLNSCTLILFKKQYDNPEFWTKNKYK